MAKILIFEDEPNIRRLLSALLQDHEVAFRNDGRDAVAHVRNSAPTVVIMDVNLPRTNGHSVFKALSAQPDLEHIPVIVVSGSAQSLEDPGFQRAFAKVLKPFDIFEIKQAIEDAILAVHTRGLESRR